MILNESEEKDNNPNISVANDLDFTMLNSLNATLADSKKQKDKSKAKIPQPSEKTNYNEVEFAKKLLFAKDENLINVNVNEIESESRRRHVSPNVSNISKSFERKADNNVKINFSKKKTPEKVIDDAKRINEKKRVPTPKPEDLIIPDNLKYKSEIDADEKLRRLKEEAQNARQTPHNKNEPSPPKTQQNYLDKFKSTDKFDSQNIFEIDDNDEYEDKLLIENMHPKKASKIENSTEMKSSVLSFGMAPPKPLDESSVAFSEDEGTEGRVTGNFPQDIPSIPKQLPMFSSEEITKLKEDLEKTQTKLKIIQLESERCAYDNQELRDRINMLEREKKHSMTDSNTFLNELTKSQAENKELMRRISELNTKLEQISLEKTKLFDEQYQMNQKLLEDKKTLIEEKQMLSVSNKELLSKIEDSTLQQDQELVKELKAKQERLELVETAHKNSKTMAIELKKSSMKLEVDIRDLKDENQQLKSKLNEHSNQNLATENNSNQKIERLESQINDLLHNIDILEKKNIQLAQGNTQSCMDAEDLRQKLSHIELQQENNSSVHSQQIKALQEKNESLESRSVLLESEIEDLQSKVDNLNEKLSEKSEALLKIESSYSSKLQEQSLKLENSESEVSRLKLLIQQKTEESLKKSEELSSSKSALENTKTQLKKEEEKTASLRSKLTEIGNLKEEGWLSPKEYEEKIQAIKEEYEDEIEDLQERYDSLDQLYQEERVAKGKAGNISLNYRPLLWK